jgi:hypothetical protein
VLKGCRTKQREIENERARVQEEAETRAPREVKHPQLLHNRKREHGWGRYVNWLRTLAGAPNAGWGAEPKAPGCPKPTAAGAPNPPAEGAPKPPATGAPKLLNPPEAGAPKAFAVGVAGAPKPPGAPNPPPGLFKSHKCESETNNKREYFETNENSPNGLVGFAKRAAAFAANIAATS